MMRRAIFLATMFVSSLFSADDGWGRVKALGSGTELRIVKAGVRTAIIGLLDEASDESVILTTKTEQLSILKEQIVKIEFIAAQAASRMARSGSRDNQTADRSGAQPSPSQGRKRGPSASSMSTYSRQGNRPNYELLWSPRGH